MLLPPFFPEQIDIAMMQKEDRIVRRRSISHVAANPAMYRVVHSSLARPFPTVGTRRIRDLGQSRGNLWLCWQIRRRVVSEFSQQSRVSRTLVPDPNLKLLCCIGKRA